MNDSYDVAFRPGTYGQLRQMPRDHMIAIMDSLNPSSPGGLNLNDPAFWYEAINRRDQELLNRRVTSLTIWIAIMTGVYTIATLFMLLVMLRAS